MSLSPGPLERVQELESAEFVAGFLSRLETSRRELFVLVMLEQMSMPEVARALDVPLNTAYTRLHRLRAEFRKALERRQRKGSRA